MKQILGIDIGGTNTEVGVVNSKGEIVKEFTFKTKNYATVKNLLKDIHEAIIKHNISISGVGIGAPNGNYYTGKIEYAPNLEWGIDVPIVKYAEEIFQLPVKLTNDANAAALGEKCFGGARFMDNFAVLTLGTGLGSGIFVNGKLVHGKHGYAGEVGHLVCDTIQRLCTCGLTGCIETVVSTRGIQQTYAEGYYQKYHKMPQTNISVAEIHELAIQNDPIAISTFNYTSFVLAIAIAHLISILDLEAIFLFGGIAQAHKILIPLLKANVYKRVLPVFREHITLLPSELLNKNAAVLGSASLFFIKNGLIYE